MCSQVGAWLLSRGWLGSGVKGGDSCSTGRGWGGGGGVSFFWGKLIYMHRFGNTGRKGRRWGTHTYPPTLSPPSFPSAPPTPFCLPHLSLLLLLLLLLWIPRQSCLREYSSQQQYIYKIHYCSGAASFPG